MTNQRPGSVQQASNPLATRGKCCCCCSLRTGVIFLGVLLLIKGVMLSFQMVYYSEHMEQYYNDSYDTTSDDKPYMGNDAITIDDDMTTSTIDDDSSTVDSMHQGGGQGQGQGQGQGGQGQGQGHGGQGGQGGQGPHSQDDSESNEEETDVPEMGNDAEQQTDLGNGPNTNVYTDEMSGDAGEEEPIIVDSAESVTVGNGDDIDVDEEEEVSVPCWIYAVAWICVGWHFIGGLLGTFAGCNYKKCCAYGFYLWWVITLTISFACGVLFLYFWGFHLCFLVAFTIFLVVCSYFTCKVKKYYNLLRDAASVAPRGYSEVNYENSV